MAACVDDQQTNYKHFCRVCKKGFMCGRALGGHMRAHGIGDESATLDDDDQVSDWEDKQGTKRMYALRTNPNRLKSVRVCENCGREFFSWKSFLEHGKCSSDDAESLVSSPESEPEYDQGRRGGCGGWSKRKRSFRAKVSSFNSICPSSEDEDLALAKCLMELANSRVDPSDVEPEVSCTSASRDEERRQPMAAFMSPYSRPSPLDKAKGVATKGMFECKACKKVFNSHQALGGHRASHKKVKGCFAARNDQIYDDGPADEDVITNDDFFPSKSPSSFQYDHGLSNPPPLVGASRRKSKVHKCSICNRVFASGQALGGHKRCHWLTSNSPADTSTLAKFTNFNDHIDHHINQRVQPSQLNNNSDHLDLNFPALGVGTGASGGIADMTGIRRDPRNPLSFEVSTEINLHPWVGKEEKDLAAGPKDEKPESHINQSYINDDQKEKDGNNDENSPVTMENVEDEVDSKVKLAKLSELKDMNVNGNSSPWLQVGLGSTAEVPTDP